MQQCPNKRHLIRSHHVMMRRLRPAASFAVTSPRKVEKTALIVPCPCKDDQGKPQPVHRSCHNRRCRLVTDNRAFSRCLVCKTPYILRTKETTVNKKWLLLARDFRDYLVGIVVVQGIIAVLAFFFWGTYTAVVASEVEDDDCSNGWNSTSSSGYEEDENGLLLYNCETVRCVMALSYLGGVGLFLFIAAC